VYNIKIMLLTPQNNPSLKARCRPCSGF